MTPKPDAAARAAALARCEAATDLYPALDAALGDIVGHRLFTLMAVDHGRGEAARIYSNRPAEYPVGGRKPLGRMTAWGEIVLGQRRPWIGRTAEDIAWAFFDHPLIASLGCASCLNVPVIDGDRVIGTINLLHAAHWYDEADAAIAAPFADLLIPPFRAWAA
jgi:GAF domain-containing protein